MFSEFVFFKKCGEKEKELCLVHSSQITSFYCIAIIVNRNDKQSNISTHRKKKNLANRNLTLSQKKISETENSIPCLLTKKLSSLMNQSFSLQPRKISGLFSKLEGCSKRLQ